MKTLAILGASGHGKVIAECAIASGCWKEIVFYDDAWPAKKNNGNFAIVGNTSKLIEVTERPDVIIGIGNNNIRLKKQAEICAAGFSIATVIHPAAIVSPSAYIGYGTVIMPGTIINADVTIGEASIINSNAVVEHDCTIASGVHISPGVSLAGAVKVNFASWVGIGASVIQQVTIGKNVIVGAGSVVLFDLPDNVTAVGVPARIIK